LTEIDPDMVLAETNQEMPESQDLKKYIRLLKPHHVSLDAGAVDVLPAGRILRITKRTICSHKGYWTTISSIGAAELLNSERAALWEPREPRQE
jgi:hypothetical protein